ncbi:hypothetical protein [Streptomyces sp. HUAS TT20]|uniref:hypothetical protein n=1 Tax=Streptomyces sp. HUAS TT20 TaxID=3447509 RepID=UPI0021D954E7|nr:hypothetical protein [Streptomyces sp. HUAS 15-9]UXY30457.1 hypothetical protein N8I87_30525 [Streptomyces sp. HUAS 15-9]
MLARRGHGDGTGAERLGEAGRDASGDGAGVDERRDTASRIDFALEALLVDFDAARAG